MPNRICGAGDPEPGVEQHRPRAQPREREVRSNGAAGHEDQSRESDVG